MLETGSTYSTPDLTLIDGYPASGLSVVLVGLGLRLRSRA